MLSKKKVSLALLAAAAFLLQKKKITYGPNVGYMWLVKRAIGLLVSRLLPIPIPRVISGKGALSSVGDALKSLGCKKALIVSDEVLVKMGLVKQCQDALDSAGVKHELYDAVVANPHTELVDEGFVIYRDKCCDGIVAVGGGSPMDVAKVIGAKAANPKDVKDYQGYFQVNNFGLRPLPPFVAVPTTAGTGSETTVAAVITDRALNKKLAIADFGLVPGVAVLDPEVLVKLPKHITAATGMDALTHAVEAYLSGWASTFTRKHSLEATGKIFRNLEVSYKDGTNLVAREAMLSASYSAGLAFTRACIGYVHAIAHQFGGMFHTPHGDANAMLLPHVLRFYLRDETEGDATSCVGRFCELAVAGGLAQSVPATWSAQASLAQQLIESICAMNLAMQIPTEIKDMKASQVAEVTKRALNEAHGAGQSPFSNPVTWLLDLGYPVPKYMAWADCERIVAACLPSAEKQVWESKPKA